MESRNVQPPNVQQPADAQMSSEATGTAAVSGVPKSAAPNSKVEECNLVYTDAEIQATEALNENLKVMNNYKTDYAYIDHEKDFMKDRLLPIHDRESICVSVAILQDFLWQTNRINNCKARQQVHSFINKAIYEMKLQQMQLDAEYSRSNLTFNHKKYEDYLRNTVQVHVEGSTVNDHIVQLLEYVAQPNTLSKNYVVCGDLMSGLKTLDHPVLFEAAKQKLDYLANTVYRPQERLDEDLAGCPVHEQVQYFAEKKKEVETTAFETVQLAGVDASESQHSDAIRTNSVRLQSVSCSLEQRLGRLPKQSELPQFQQAVNALSKARNRKPMAECSKEEKAQAIVAVALENHWILQTFIRNRVMNNDFFLHTKVNDFINKIMAMDEPLEFSEAMQFDVFVTKPEKLVEAYNNISKLKQIQLIKLVPEFTASRQMVTAHLIYSRKLLCKLTIRVNTYQVNQEAHQFLSSLALASNFTEFKNHVLRKMSYLTGEGLTYLPYYDQKIWSERVAEYKQEHLAAQQLAGVDNQQQEDELVKV